MAIVNKGIGTRALCAALLMGSAAPIALAQAAGDASDATDARKLDTVLVTANKREESLQDYAGSLTAISSEALDGAGVVNMQDIKDLVPNLYLEEDLGGATTPKIFVRGIGIDNPDVSFDSPVGVYVDGVYMARSFGSLVDMFDVERVEFLRGPQGTIYGRNNSAGALRIVTKQPDLEGAEFGGGLSIGTEGQINTQGYFSAPIVEGKLAGRVAFGSRTNDGFQTELSTGKKFKRDDVTSARAALLYSPNETWNVTARADVLLDRGAGSGAASIVPAFDPDGDPYRFTSNRAAAASSRLEAWGTSVEVTHESDWADFTSITAYRSIDQDLAGGDADGSVLSLLEGNVQNLNQYQISQEAFLVGDSLFGNQALGWTAGAYYFTESNKIARTFTVFPGLFGPDTTQNGRLETDALAVYGEVEFEATEQLRLTAGARFTDEEKTVELDSFDPIPANNFSASDSLTEDRWTWKIAAEYDINDNVMAYGSVSTGFRSGGIGLNPAARSTANVISDKFGPETAMNYEGGVRATLFDGRAQVAGTYFYVEYESLQLAAAGAGGITVATPDATVQGFEGELTALLTDNLTLVGTVGTMDDEVKDAVTVLKNTPEWQGRLGLNYTVPASILNGSVTLAGDVSYRDDYFVNTANTTSIDGYSTTNASVRWDSDNGHWGLALSGKNLGDEYYPIHEFRIIPGLLVSQFPNHPRRWLLTLTVRN